MLKERTWLCCLLLVCGSALADDPPEEEEEKPPPVERPLLWDKEKAPRPGSFTDEEKPPPLVEGPGPWDLHPKETPVIVGPWAVDRRGSAPTDVERDGSARPQVIPPARWGNQGMDPDVVEASPWAQDRKSDGKGKDRLAPLGDHFQVRILGHEPDALLIELPILVAKSPSSFEGSSYWLVVEIFAGQKKVGDHRVMVSRETLATMGPTHVWVKAMVPTPKPQGELTIRVLRIDPGATEVRPIFERKLKYGK